MLLGPGYKDITIACVVKLFIHCAIKMEAVVKGLAAKYRNCTDLRLEDKNSILDKNNILVVMTYTGHYVTVNDKSHHEHYEN